MAPSLKFKPIVGVDARPLSYGYTGNSRYLLEALRFLVRKDSHFEFKLYSNKPIHPVFHDFLDSSEVSIGELRKEIGLIWLNFTLPQLLKKDKIDLFWGTLQLLPFKKLDIPTIVNYHDLNFISAPKTMTFTNYIQHKILSKFSLKNANKVICLSENTKYDIIKYMPEVEEKLEVVYPGTRKIESEPEKIDIENYILTISTLEPRKNIRTLLDAYLKIVSRNPNFPHKLVIAGRVGWGEKKLTEELLNGTYKDKGVVFIDNPSEGKLAYLLKNCEFFLFPSIHEGFGLPILEAMAEEKCCITSDIPVFREIIEENYDLLALPLNVDSWIEKILTMSSRSEKQKHRVFKENKWSWYNTGKQIEEGISSVWKEHIKEKTLKHVV